MTDTNVAVDTANAEALRRVCDAEPILVDVGTAGQVIPNFTPATILTSGPTLPWEQYVGGQRAALIGGVLYEGLAASEADAVRKLSSGEVHIASCHDFGAVGSVAGIYTASMPVFVVRNLKGGTVGFCTLYEGKVPQRLNYGVYNDSVRERLVMLRDVVAPVLQAAVRRCGGIALRPLMARALHMGDELHSRNTAASLLFADQLVPSLVELVSEGSLSADRVKSVLRVLTEDNYFFLRLSMAACKATADSIKNIPRCSVVTAMSLNCRGFSIRVSGLGDRWLTGPHADVSQAQFFEGSSAQDVAWMGGESVITETVGLGGFAQAAAFPLQGYQGGSPEVMIANNLAMYEITAGEHEHFRIPYFGYRGTPTCIDIRKVVATGILPVIDAGIAGKNGGQIGAGVIRAPRECFELALREFQSKYGSMP